MKKKRLISLLTAIAMSFSMLTAMPMSIVNAEGDEFNVLKEGYLFIDGRHPNLYQKNEETGEYFLYEPGDGPYQGKGTQIDENGFIIPSAFPDAEAGYFHADCLKETFDDSYLAPFYQDMLERGFINTFRAGLRYQATAQDANEYETQLWLKENNIQSTELPVFYYKQESDNPIPDDVPQEFRLPIQDTWEYVNIEGHSSTFGITATVDGSDLVIYVDEEGGWCDDGMYGVGEVEISIFEKGKRYCLYSCPMLYSSVEAKREITQYLKSVMEEKCAGMSQVDTMYTMAKFLHENFQHTTAGGTIYGTLFGGLPGDCWVFADMLTYVANIMGVHWYERRPCNLQSGTSQTHYNVCVELDGEPYIVDASNIFYVYKTKDGVKYRYDNDIQVTDDGLYAYKEYTDGVILYECFDFSDTVFIPELINGKPIKKIVSEALYSCRPHYIVPSSAQLWPRVADARASDVSNYDNQILLEKAHSSHDVWCDTFMIPAGTRVVQYYTDKMADDGTFYGAGSVVYEPGEEILSPEEYGHDAVSYKITKSYEVDTWKGGWYSSDTWKPYTSVPEDLAEPTETITEETTEETFVTEPTETVTEETTEETFATEPTEPITEESTEETFATEPTETVTEETNVQLTDAVPIQYNIPLLEADNNSDGSVNASDAAAILVYASLQGAGADMSDVSGEEHMDVNGDGIINATDAAVILEISAKIGSGDVVEYLDEYRVSQEATEE